MAQTVVCDLCNAEPAYWISTVIDTGDTQGIGLNCAPAVYRRIADGIEAAMAEARAEAPAPEPESTGEPAPAAEPAEPFQGTEPAASAVTGPNGTQSQAHEPAAAADKS